MASKTRRWKVFLNLATVGALVLLGYLTRHQIAETVRNLGQVNTYALALIIPLQLLNYDSYARMYRSFFRILGTETSYKSMYRVSLELNFVNHVFPSGGVSGFSFFSVRLKPQGISTAKSTLVQMMKFIFLFLSFEILLGIGLLMLALGGHVNNFTILVGASLVTLLAVLTVGLAFVIGSRKRIKSFFTFVTVNLNRLIHVIRPKHPETINVERVQTVFNELHDNYMIFKSDYSALRGPLISALIANATEILTVYVVYIAFGHWVNPGAVILAYAVANFAGLISVLPGGVGIYEALMTAVLAAAGVSPGISIPVTVMYRVLNMLIQMAPGYYFYQRNLRQKNQVV